MKILTIDTSTRIATVCITNNYDLIGEININCDKKHSEILMPTIKNLFNITNYNINEIDYIACVNGPGSFTGLRVGASTCKALAMALDKKIISVTSLDSLAYNIGERHKTIIPILDARGGNVFTAFYKYLQNGLKQVKEPILINIEDLLKLIKNEDLNPIFIGDAVEIYKTQIEKFNSKYELANKRFNSQRAYLTALLAIKYAKEEKYLKYDKFELNYIRKSQAEVQTESQI